MEPVSDDDRVELVNSVQSSEVDDGLKDVRAPSAELDDVVLGIGNE